MIHIKLFSRINRNTYKSAHSHFFSIKISQYQSKDTSKEYNFNKQTITTLDPSSFVKASSKSSNAFQLYSKCKSYLLSNTLVYLLPKGYPHSVSNGYREFVIYQMIGK